MPSHHSYYPIMGRQHVPMKGSLVGGSVSLLRNSVIKNTDSERLLGGRGLGANKFVGIVSSGPVRQDTTKSVQTVFKGGELLNGLHFAHKMGAAHQQNIKFLF